MHALSSPSTLLLSRCCELDSPERRQTLETSLVLAFCLKDPDPAQVPWVSAKVLHRLMPQANLHIEQGGGHFAYYACTRESQRNALKQLLRTGLPQRQQVWPSKIVHNSVH